MQIIPPLTLPSLGFGQLRKLVQPLLISHGCPASGAHRSHTALAGAWAHRFVPYRCPDSVCFSGGGRVFL